jgi:hypothetical protein
MSAAPAAVSDFLKQHIKFGGTGETLRLSGLIAVAQIGQGDTAGQTSSMIDGNNSEIAAMRLSPTAPIGLAAATLDPEDSAFISPALDLLGSAFTRYKVNKCKFHYRPQSGTNSTQQLVFAFAADPVHPLVGALNSGPNPVTLESLSDSIPFAPWAPWDLDVTGKLDKGPWQYTDIGSADESSSTSISRLSCFGSIAIAAGTESTTTNVNYGVLYMSFEMEFKEFCPISVTRPSMLRLQEKLRSHEMKSILAHDRSRRANTPRCVESPSVQGLSTAMSSDVATSSSPLPKVTVRVISADQLRRYVQRLRSEGWEMRAAVSHIASLYTFGPDAQKLCLDSGIDVPPKGNKVKIPKSEEASFCDDSSDDDGFHCTPSVSVKCDSGLGNLNVTRGKEE